jgi:hypothetical protein
VIGDEIHRKGIFAGTSSWRGKRFRFFFFSFWVDGRKENTWIVGGKGKDDDDDDDDNDNESNLTRGPLLYNDGIFIFCNVVGLLETPPSGKRLVWF